MGRYILAESAAEDLHQIIAYIARQNRDAAKRVRSEFRATMRKLADFPNIGHERRDSKDPTLKFWTLYSYVIAYRPGTKPLEIARIIHGARDVGRELES
jgi:toxin ParE1/3/4